MVVWSDRGGRGWQDGGDQLGCDAAGLGVCGRVGEGFGAGHHGLRRGVQQPQLPGRRDLLHAERDEYLLGSAVASAGRR